MSKVDRSRERISNQSTNPKPYALTLILHTGPCPAPCPVPCTRSPVRREQLRATRATLSDGSASEIALGVAGEAPTFEALSRSRGAPVGFQVFLF